MKIEFEIEDINRGELVDAMAKQLLTDMARSYSDDGDEVYEHIGKSALGKSLAQSVKAMLEEHAHTMVREHFDATIKARIEKAVDDVLEVGWFKTDHYGHATGERIDLKGRINEVITEKKSNGYDREKFTLAEKLVLEKVREVFTTHLNAEVEAARVSLKKQLDAVVAGKFTETIKQALGLR